jgi:hypothetical protein
MPRGGRWLSSTPNGMALAEDDVKVVNKALDVVQNSDKLLINKTARRQIKAAAGRRLVSGSHRRAGESAVAAVVHLRVLAPVRQCRHP